MSQRLATGGSFCIAAAEGVGVAVGLLVGVGVAVSVGVRVGGVVRVGVALGAGAEVAPVSVSYQGKTTVPEAGDRIYEPSNEAGSDGHA